MVMYLVLILCSCMSYSSSPSYVESPVSGSSADSDVIAEAVSQMFNADNGYFREDIRMHATRVIAEDVASPIRVGARARSFSLDNDDDRHYANRVAIRASELVMEELRQRSDQKWSKKKAAAASITSSVISSVIIFAITYINKE